MRLMETKSCKMRAPHTAPAQASAAASSVRVSTLLIAVCALVL